MFCTHRFAGASLRSESESDINIMSAPSGIGDGGLWRFVRLLRCADGICQSSSRVSRLGSSSIN